MFLFSSGRVVGTARVNSCIYVADCTESEMSCFRPSTLYLSFMDPPHIRVWFPCCCTIDINRTPIIVICTSYSRMTDNGWLCKLKSSVKNYIASRYQTSHILTVVSRKLASAQLLCLIQGDFFVDTIVCRAKLTYVIP